MSHGNNPPFISVDIESSGPVPGQFSMLSLGACVVGDMNLTFYRELRPVTLHHDPEALAVTGFELGQLLISGAEPVSVMGDFSEWVKSVCPQEVMPVFAGFNAAFDWSFVNWYFHYTGVTNPFGYAPLDIKSFFAARNPAGWRDARSSVAAHQYGLTRSKEHHALDDAIFQASLLQAMLSNSEVTQ